MKLTDYYKGSDDPFEGDRTLWLRSLPEDTRVTKAFVTLTPKGGPQFQETFVLDTAAGLGELPADKWGVTKTPPGSFIEVDFHARRTLARVTGSGGASTLQVDMGGAYMGVADDGTFNPDRNPWPVALSADGNALPALTVNKFQLSQAPDNTNPLDVTKVTIRSVPTNVSVRLGQMPPFWTHLGELVTPKTSSDFSAVLNAFLAEASAENGFYAIPFVVHSDTIARLDVTLVIDYVIEQPVLPTYLPEVTLPYGYSSLPGVEEDLLTLNLPRKAKPVAGTGGAVRGVFDVSRVVLGEIGETGATATTTVSPERSLAQPIQLAAETPVSGIDLPLANTQPGVAGLHLALQADADGKPSGEVLTSAEVSVEKPAPGGSAWGSAALPAEFRFLPGVRYWLVLQSVSGKAYWDVGLGDPAVPALQASTDGGLSWRTATTEAGEKPLSALFRLRHTPERFSVPVQLQIGKGPDAVRARFDRFAPLGRVEFDADFAAELGEYLASPVTASLCGMGELLTNGSFDEPPHTDATRRLFGFDAGDNWALQGMVDLSRRVNLAVQRFVHLSVDGKEAIRIDCAGANPSSTGLNEIIDAINQAVGDDIASQASQDTGQLRLESPSGDDGLVVLQPWHQAGLPQGWQQPAEARGEIWRLKLPTISYVRSEGDGPGAWRPERIVAALVAKGHEPAQLAQKVPVAGGCTYVLRYLFRHCVAAKELGVSLAALSTILWPALNRSSVKLPFWEVRWSDAGGQVISSQSDGIGAAGQISSGTDGMLQSEARLVAPLGAAQAEIRFIQPSPGILFLDNVSFTPTCEALRNGNFQQWEVEFGNYLSPAGWTRLSGWLDSELDETGQVVGAKLRGGGPEDAILGQTAEVISGESYELRVRARPVFPPADDVETRSPEQRARLELRWLDDDAAIGEPVTLPLDGRGFSTRAWAGTAPARAIQAEIRLIQPRGGGELLVESVSLRRVDLVSIPLIFLAEAPGELTVSDLRVAYESPGLR